MINLSRIFTVSLSIFKGSSTEELNESDGFIQWNTLCSHRKKIGSCLYTYMQN